MYLYQVVQKHNEVVSTRGQREFQIGQQEKTSETPAFEPLSFAIDLIGKTTYKLPTLHPSLTSKTFETTEKLPRDESSAFATVFLQEATENKKKDSKAADDIPLIYTTLQQKKL